MSYKISHFVLVLVLFSSCKKIETPNEQSKLLFGAWKYISSSGGFSGGGVSEIGFVDKGVEFTNKGQRFDYNNGKKEEGNNYSFETKKSIFSGQDEVMISYKNSFSQSFKISNDTLYLSDEVNDGYNYIYLKR